MKQPRAGIQSGYTYLVVLVLLAIVALASALTLEVADTNARRSAEREWLAVGKEFERAFASYYRQRPLDGRPYPARLEDLTRDPRVAGIRRHLRRVYADPLTGGEWGTVPAPGGGIMAVYSTASGAPFREDIGPLAMPPLAGASAADASASYTQWRFGYDPTNDLRNRDSGTRSPVAAAPAASAVASRPQ